MLPKVIAIVGPTASGKSALGVFLAKKLGGEVISADSRQVYKGMRVISRAEPGHMVGIADPARQYNVVRYVRDATKCFDVMIHQNKIPIVAGGAGFYTDALLRGWQLPEVAPNRALRAKLGKKTSVQLLQELKRLDPKSARRIDPRNKVRLIRAVEIAKKLGTIPALTEQGVYDVLWLGLREPKNLKAGVEARLRRGMVAEARKLRTILPRKRFAELGFEFTLLGDYLDKKLTKKELVENIANGERIYAKRQSRWFKRNSDINWVTNKTEALRMAKKFLRA